MPSQNKRDLTMDVYRRHCYDANSLSIRDAKAKIKSCARTSPHSVSLEQENIIYIYIYIFNFAALEFI